MNNQSSKLQNFLKVRQHQVGDTFVHSKLILKICEGDSCDGCFFWIPDVRVCNYRTPSEGDFFEPCSPVIRTDEKSVIFVIVGEVEDDE